MVATEEAAAGLCPPCTRTGDEKAEGLLVVIGGRRQTERLEPSLRIVWKRCADRCDCDQMKNFVTDHIVAAADLMGTSIQLGMLRLELELNAGEFSELQIRSPAQLSVHGI
jgi:hypothetical protein